MNIGQILEKRKKHEIPIVNEWGIVQINNKEEIAYAFKIYNDEHFNGDLTGIEELSGCHIIFIDLDTHTKKGEYKNLHLLKQFSRLNKLKLKSKFISPSNIKDLGVVLHLNLLYQLLISVENGSRLLLLDTYNDKVKLKYYLNIKFLLDER